MKSWTVTKDGKPAGTCTANPTWARWKESQGYKLTPLNEEAKKWMKNRTEI